MCVYARTHARTHAHAHAHAHRHAQTHTEHRKRTHALPHAPTPTCPHTHHARAQSRVVHQVLAVSMLACSLSVAAEAVWPTSFLATCARVASTLWQVRLHLHLALALAHCCGVCRLLEEEMQPAGCHVMSVAAVPIFTSARVYMCVCVGVCVAWFPTSRNVWPVVRVLLNDRSGKLRCLCRHWSARCCHGGLAWRLFAVDRKAVHGSLNSAR